MAVAGVDFGLVADIEIKNGFWDNGVFYCLDYDINNESSIYKSLDGCNTFELINDNGGYGYITILGLNNGVKYCIDKSLRVFISYDNFITTELVDNAYFIDGYRIHNFVAYSDGNIAIFTKAKDYKVVYTFDGYTYHSGSILPNSLSPISITTYKGYYYILGQIGNLNNTFIYKTNDFINYTLVHTGYNEEIRHLASDSTYIYIVKRTNVPTYSNVRRTTDFTDIEEIYNIGVNGYEIYAIIMLGDGKFTIINSDETAHTTADYGDTFTDINLPYLIQGVSSNYGDPTDQFNRLYFNDIFIVPGVYGNNFNHGTLKSGDFIGEIIEVDETYYLNFENGAWYGDYGYTSGGFDYLYTGFGGADSDVTGEYPIPVTGHVYNDGSGNLIGSAGGYVQIDGVWYRVTGKLTGKLSGMLIIRTKSNTRKYIKLLLETDNNTAGYVTKAKIKGVYRQFKLKTIPATDTRAGMIRVLIDGVEVSVAFVDIVL